MTFNYRGSSLGLVSRGSLGAQHMSVPSKKLMIYALSVHVEVMGLQLLL